MMRHQIELGSFSNSHKFREALLPVMNAAVLGAVTTKDPYCCKMAVAGLLAQFAEDYLTDTTSPNKSAYESYLSYLIDHVVPKPQAGGVSARTASVEPVNATSSAITYANEKGIDLSNVQGTGTGGRITLEDVKKYA